MEGLKWRKQDGVGTSTFLLVFLQMNTFSDWRHSCLTYSFTWLEKARFSTVLCHSWPTGSACFMHSKNSFCLTSCWTITRRKLAGSMIQFHLAAQSAGCVIADAVSSFIHVVGGPKTAATLGSTNRKYSTLKLLYHRKLVKPLGQSFGICRLPPTFQTHVSHPMTALTLSFFTILWCKLILHKTLAWPQISFSWYCINTSHRCFEHEVIEVSLHTAYNFS